MTTIEKIIDRSICLVFFAIGLVEMIGGFVEGRWYMIAFAVMCFTLSVMLWAEDNDDNNNK